MELKIEKRDERGRDARRVGAGRMPGVFYGRKERASPVFVSAKDFSKVWKEAGESTVITLVGLGEPKDALIHDVDLDPVSGVPRHVDFYVLEKGKKVQVPVPLEFIGVSPAVKDLGGTLVKVLHEVEVEAFPKDLPHEISVDISSIVNFETQIHVKDLPAPSGVAILNDGDEVVALVTEVKEEVEEPVEAPDLSTVEVEKRGKEKEEGEEGGSLEEAK